ncbi:hypothetical protein GQX74_009647 [Glossina fuscipes]|nr:hypothetical protein GQX74_009647 [Glossina fuscipes]
MAAKCVRLQSPAKKINLAAEEQKPKAALQKMKQADTTQEHTSAALRCINRTKENLRRLDVEFVDQQEEDRNKENEVKAVRNKEHIKIFGMQSYKAKAPNEVKNKNIVKPGLVSLITVLFETQVPNIQTARKNYIDLSVQERITFFENTKRENTSSSSGITSLQSSYPLRRSSATSVRALVDVFNKKRIKDDMLTYVEKKRYECIIKSFETRSRSAK